MLLIAIKLIARNKRKNTVTRLIVSKLKELTRLHRCKVLQVLVSQHPNKRNKRHKITLQELVTH